MLCQCHLRRSTWHHTPGPHKLAQFPTTTRWVLSHLSNYRVNTSPFLGLFLAHPRFPRFLPADFPRSEEKLAHHRSHTVPTQGPSMTSEWHVPIPSTLSSLLAESQTTSVLKAPAAFRMVSVPSAPNSLSVCLSVYSLSLCSNSSSNFDTPLPILTSTSQGACVSLRLLPDPLQGPVLQGLPGNVQNQTQTAGHTSFRSSQTEALMDPTCLKGPQILLSDGLLPQRCGIQDPSSWPTRGPCTPGEGLQQALGTTKVMFSALPPCPEQRETAGKGQGHDSLINTVPGTREREEEH